MFNLASKAEGRTTSVYIYIRLKPPLELEVGEPDAVQKVGKDLVTEFLLALKAEAEAQGFEVDADIRQVSY